MSTISPETRLLVARARLGDPEAFASLVHAYTPRLLWYVRKLGLCENDAGDVLQESWVTAWTTLNRLRDVALFRSWLYGIARHKALQEMTKARRHATLPDDVEWPGEPPDESYFEKYQSELNRALERLPLQHREVLGLRFLEAMSYEELAQAIGVPVGTIKSRLHHAKCRLRDELERLTHA